MAIIYRLRYWSNGEPVEENFLQKQEAIFAYDRALEKSKVEGVDLYRQQVMRPSVKTILRILNGQPYVLDQRKILTTGNNYKGPSE